MEKVPGFNFQKSFERAEMNVHEGVSMVSASRKRSSKETHTKYVKNVLVGITSMICRLKLANTYLGPQKKWLIKSDDFKTKLTWCKTLIA